MTSLSNKEKRDAVLYNLLPGDREKIAAYQGGKDPITLEPLKPNANCDHDHQTGLIRGLLNPMTNKRLQDDTVKLVRTLNYLENPPAVAALGRESMGLWDERPRSESGTALTVNPDLNREPWKCANCEKLIYNLDRQGKPAPGSPPMPKWGGPEHQKVCTAFASK
jgi:hypothetical protein